MSTNNPSTNVMDCFKWLHEQPTCQGSIKANPQDFIVNEQLGFTFSGAGEHLMVKIRKTGENTKYVVNELAKACGVKSRDVSWAGLKDRHAVTEQWISVHLPGKADPDLTQFEAEHPGIEVLETTRHDKKLRPGDLQGNWFQLRLTDLDQPQVLAERLELVKQQGVANYFGQQRFGHGGNNVIKARAWGNNEFRVRDKSKRSFYLSAARSWMFNQVLSARIEQNLTREVMLGDCLQAAGDERTFIAETITPELQQQVMQGEVAITGPLLGDNALPTTADAQAFELAIVEQEPALVALVRDNRMRHDRRPLLLLPQDMQWQFDDNGVILSFALPAGSFATSVVRELIMPLESEGMNDENTDQQ